MSETYPAHDTTETGTTDALSKMAETPQLAYAPAKRGTVGRFGDRVGIGIALFSLYVIWGSTYLGMRFALESFPPFLMAGIRFLIAGSLLYSVLRLRGVASPTRAQWVGAALVGTLLLAGGNGGIAFAEQWVASGLAAVAVAAVPLWTTFLIGLTGRWPSRIEWLGLVLGFGGVLLLNVGNNVWATPVGAVALLLGPFCWASGSALSSRVSLPPGLMSSAAQMIVGGVVMLPIGLLTGERITHAPTWNALWAMLFLVLFGSLVAFSAYGYLLKRVRPTLATSYAYVNPAVALGLGALLAGERLTLFGVLAMLVILTGVGLVSLGKGRKRGSIEH